LPFVFGIHELSISVMNTSTSALFSLINLPTL
jgi:hypothetical protein